MDKGEFFFYKRSEILCFVFLFVFFILISLGFSQETFEENIPIKEVKAIAILNKDEYGKSFMFPISVAIDPVTYEIYVVDSGKSEITIYSPDFFPKITLDKGRGLRAPYGVAIDKDGTFYVIQAPSSGKPACLSIFNSAGLLEKEIYFKDLSFEGCSNFIPVSIALDRRYIYIAGEGFEGVLVLNKKGDFEKIITVKDSITMDFPKKRAKIRAVYVDKKGRLYLLSEEMGRFYVFDSLGNFLFKGGIKGGTPGKLSRPRGIVADPNLGLILVVDYMRHSGLAYDYNNGHFLFEFGGKGWSPGWFNGPTDIKIDRFGRIYVADLFNRRVQVLVLGKEITPYLGPSFITPLQPVKKRLNKVR